LNKFLLTDDRAHLKAVPDIRKETDYWLGEADRLSNTSREDELIVLPPARGDPVTRGRRYILLPFLYHDEAAKIRDANRKFLAEEATAPQAQGPALR
jgi:hypothetical protein